VVLWVTQLGQEVSQTWQAKLKAQYRGARGWLGDPHGEEEGDN
jgi:hypothetical protein